MRGGLLPGISGDVGEPAPVKPTIALIGDPVRGSISPAMHRAAFAHLGLDMDYVAVPVGRADLAQALPRLVRRFAGLNVTTPLKEDVLPFLDRVSPDARRAGSVNTVLFRDERSEGHTTDGAGFVAALRAHATGPLTRALVLGTGGAARAVAIALTDEGTEVLVSGRNLDRGSKLARGLGVAFVPASEVAEAMADSTLLVNATPLGAAPRAEETPLPPSAPLRPGLVVFDLVYRPRRTALLQAAQAVGCTVIEGVEMLVEQGGRSFELWTGRPAPVDVMRSAAYRALAENDHDRPIRSLPVAGSA
jgi:shikimate dehydrogenase